MSTETYRGVRLKVRKGSKWGRLAHYVNGQPWANGKAAMRPQRSPACTATWMTRSSGPKRTRITGSQATKADRANPREHHARLVRAWCYGPEPRVRPGKGPFPSSVTASVTA